MDKWVLQIINGENFEHILTMVENNVGKVDIKVVSMGPSIIPLFAFGKLRQKIEELIQKGLKLEICSVSIQKAGLEKALAPKGSILKPGLIAISDAVKDGYLYFAIA
jgi:intracellular sulfur oxidation DsrE/DsrF family protein